MKKILLVVCIFLIGGFARSQNTQYNHDAFDKSLKNISVDIANKLLIKGMKKIAVVYITDINKTQTVLGKYMADVISVNIVNDIGDFEVFDRENLSGIREAKTLIDEGFIDKNRVQELGKLLNVDVFIIGNYTVFSSTINLSLKALDTKTGFVIAATRMDVILTKDAVVAFFPSSDVNSPNYKDDDNNRPLNSGETYLQKSANKDCATVNTGDYSVTNSTNTSKAFRIYLKPKTPSGLVMPSLPTAGEQYQDLSLKPNETQCIYNFDAKAYQCEIWGANYQKQTVKIKDFNIVIEQCRTKKLIIR